MLLSLLVPLVYAASEQGIVSLWSDSSCGNGATTNHGEKDPVALNYTLSVDVCGVPGVVYRSFRIYQRPTCANGVLAASAFYNNTDCKNDDYGFGPIISIDSEPDHYNSAICPALVDFNSLAFLCAGLGVTGGASLTNIFSSSATKAVASSIASSATSLTNDFYSSASKATTSTIASSPSATPISPSASMTSPLYTAPAGSSFPNSVLINTASSGIIGPSAGFTTAPFTPGFTGAAPRVGGSVAGVFVVLGGAVLL